MTSSAAKQNSSATADWVRAMQRTAPIAPSGTRTIATAISDMAKAFPERLPLIGERETLTYGDLSALIDRYASWGHRQGLRQGDIVALMMGNSPEYVAIWAGLTRLGVLTALLNTQLVGAGLIHCINVASPKLLIVDTAHRADVEHVIGESTPWWVCDANVDMSRAIQLGHADDVDLPTITLGEPALLIYTSGTTGLPKAARVSHYRIMMWSEWFAGIMDASPQDRLYNCLPMYHSIGGVVAVGAMLVAGGAVIVRNSFSATRFWPDVVGSKATIFQYIGELCRYLLQTVGPDQSIGHQLRLCCGNGLRADVWTEFEKRFDIPRIIEFYAATEGSFSLFNLEGRAGAIGRIPPFMAHRSPVALARFDNDASQPVRGDDGFCIRCVNDEVGEAIGMIAANPNALATRFEGYTNEEDSKKKVLRDVFSAGDAWFRTGDLMRRDARGFYFFVDRIGDTFRWKGENVSTTDVADTLAACPGIREATVYGVEVPSMDGRAGMAALVVNDGFNVSDLARYVEEYLPRYARPVFLRLCSHLDATGTFKVRKADLVEDGFDPSTVRDPLFVLVDNRYQRVDEALHARLASGNVRL